MQLVSMTMVFIVLLAGCSREQSDKPAAQKQADQTTATIVQEKSSVQTVKMEELLKDPKAYEGKDVVVGGVFNNICCADDFVLKDGLNAIEVYVTDQCPMPDKSKLRSKMQVHGTVKVKGDDVTLVAKEVKFE
jgi:PBP1b-binding outer membrane lipoprotein LpoB